MGCSTPHVDQLNDISRAIPVSIGKESNMMNLKPTRRASLAIGAVAALTASFATLPTTAGAIASGGVSITETNDGLVVTGSSDKDFIEIVLAPDGAVGVRAFADNGHLVDRLMVDDFAGNLSVDLGENDDSLHVSGLELGAVKIKMGTGKDGVGIDKTSLSSLTVYGGEGDDYLRLREVEGESAQIDTGKGKGRIEINESVFEVTNIATNTDDDRVTFSGSSLGAALIFTYSGNDRVIMNKALLTYLHISLGEGDDNATIGFKDDLDPSHINIYGEDGKDTLTIKTGFEIIPQTVKFDGGADHDTFNSPAVDIWSLLSVEEIT
ncbi:MAG: hypothetical protein GY708_17605 [Actinomycetia bacterium]|nr:hypothetical protein [Actinomycetes bacterium]